MAKAERPRLGEILVQQRLLTQEALELALTEQKNAPRRMGRVRRLGRVLVEKGLVLEEKVAQALALQLEVPYVDLKQFPIRNEFTQKLPETVARRYRCVLLEDLGKSYRVGMSDPTDLNAYDEVARALQREIQVGVVADSQLLAVLDRVYRRTGEISGFAKELGAAIGEAAPAPATSGFTGSPGTEEAPVVKLLQSVFEDATQVRASDVHIEPQERKLAIRFRIDGVLYPQTEADVKIAAALVQRLKLMSGLDISEKRLPQDGRFNVKTRGTNLDVRISTMPTQFGESVVMRLLNQSGGVLTLDRLGMPPKILERVRAVLSHPSGMVLVTGPTGSGKTTTLYAALAELNTPAHKIITVEDPIEYRLPGINQVQVHDKIELTFGRVLRSALRQDPDILLLGEMRDQETVETGLRAAMTGHMVLSTLHTNDAATTPIRLLDMGAPRYMVAYSLQLVLAQRLVRLTCDSCAEPYEPLPGERAWLDQALRNGPQERYLRGKGCPNCNNTGFLGRTGVYEMLELTRPVIEAIHGEDPAVFMQAAIREIGVNTLSAHAAALAAAGRTTPQEAMRISTPMED
ncbi:MAG TPA: GspE/PulE family protein [Burkholderiales bacterium]|nr:GspE/PulE family protein [Burkholderiales bacterium]